MTRASYPRTAALALSILLAGLAGCGMPSADGPADTYEIDFSMPADSRLDGALVFYVDGLNAGIFQEMLEAGELPAIEKYFLDRGLYVPRAVGNTPSVTLANLTSFVTGEMPGHHGVTGINWWDRNRLIWRDYATIAQKNTLDGDYTDRNLYEHLGERTTFSVFFQPHRRTTKFIENWTSAGPPFYFGWYKFVDRLTLYRLNIVAEIARKRREWPGVTVAYLLSPDFMAYAHGVKSEPYRDAIRHTDFQIGRVCGDLAQAGLLDDVTLVLVSDHGLGEVERHFPIHDFLCDEVGLHVAKERLWEKSSFEERFDYYREFPAVLYGSGDRYWAVCLRKPLDGTGRNFADWLERPDAEDLSAYPVHKPPGGLAALFAEEPPAEAPRKDLLTILVQQDAVDAVAWRVGENRVRVRRKTGEVEFRQPGGRGKPISYHLVAGDDPFGWEGKVPAAALKGRPMSGREWLTATHETEYPDLPEPIVAYFRARRAGDIAVFAAPGWDLSDKHRAGHGGLRPDEMYVPLLMAGPGIAKQRVDVARAIDVMPTLLQRLGRPVPRGIDGRVIPEAARR